MNNQETTTNKDGASDRVVSTGGFGKLSAAARAYHEEYWEWFWHTDKRTTIGEKRAELRAKHGEAAEAELIDALRAAGVLPKQ